MILHQFEDTNVSLPGFLVQHLIQSRLNYRPLTIKVNIIYKYQMLQGIHCSKQIYLPTKNNLAPNLHPNLIIDLRAPKHATPPPLPPTTYLQQSRPDPRHQGLDSPEWCPVGSGSDAKEPTDPPLKKNIWLCFLFQTWKRRKPKKKSVETQNETNIKCFFQKKKHHDVSKHRWIKQHQALDLSKLC